MRTTPTASPSKIQRKAARVERSAITVEFNTELGELKRQRDKTLAKTNTAFHDGLEKLKNDRAKARKEAWEVYDEARDELLTKLAAKEAAS